MYYLVTIATAKVEELGESLPVSDAIAAADSAVDSGAAAAFVFETRGNPTPDFVCSTTPRANDAAADVTMEILALDTLLSHIHPATENA